MFEVLSSQYLELSSDEAVRAKHKAVAVEFLAEGTYLRTYVKYIRETCPLSQGVFKQMLICAADSWGHVNYVFVRGVTYVRRRGS